MVNERGNRVELENQHVLALTAQNVLRLRVFKVKFDDPTGVKLITGRNRQGKSSAINAIIMAFGGHKVLKNEVVDPIRSGEEKLTIILETEDLIIKRTQSRTGHKTLVVESKDNLRYPTPQSVLDGLFNELAFDPAEFAACGTDTASQRNQVKTLLNLFPVNFDFDQYAKGKRDIKDDRRVVNKEIKRLEAKREELGDVKKVDEIDEVELVNQIARLRRSIQNFDNSTESLERIESQITTSEEIIKREQEKLEKYREAKDKIVESRKKFDENKVKEAIATLETKLKKAKETNKQAEDYETLQDLKKQEEAYLEELSGYEKSLKEMEDAKEKALKEAKIPVDGLTISEDMTLLYDGKPLCQCSDAEQITIGVKLASASAKKLRIAFIKRGSLLDKEHRELFAKLAKEHDMQFIMEVVEGDEKNAIVIEDGTNLSDEEIEQFEEEQVSTNPAQKKAKKKAKKKRKDKKASKVDPKPKHDAHDPFDGDDLFD